MKIAEVIHCLEQWAPRSLQESYDNSGLIVGDKAAEVSAVLVCLDSVEEVVDEAIEKGCNLIVAHHPIVFSGLKQFTGADYIQRTVIKAIKHDIAIYAIHTNLDHVSDGVNHMIADKIGLRKRNILQPKKGELKKLTVFVPVEHMEKVQEACWQTGAGKISTYDSCSYFTQGSGTFRALEGANPFVGEVNQVHHESEARLEFVVPARVKSQVEKALIATHPYETPAYDWVSLENRDHSVGAGMIGELEEELPWRTFLSALKEKMNVGSIRYTKSPKEKVKRIAICGGSGSFLLNDAIGQNADVFITGDFKYHQFFDANGKIQIADIGHFESEQFTTELIAVKLKQNFATFAVLLTEVNTNPINYL